ncbi:calcium-responsive transcription factor-like [Mizuhopecten yessoensis]|uniref:Calcium-responsive transcription factor n=1 Tax=Mizuhopecten yessoensis TaxID=6573 RepID=A0A210PMA9_MIZYE|nr:calcium-responsive transcription factor-like [Mizuhopecten yessoensis]XP_021380037.1 calcium-responsive transcription factor-like [Mizuhopecten yessoensis]OWF37566.1 Calcium-responsive transcription factor [Mizuhopecten yessoensis]
MADGEDEVSSSTDPVSCGIVLRHPDDLGVSASKYKAVSPDEGLGDLSISSVSPSLANPTLQGLLSSPVSLPGSQLIGGTEGIQIIAVSASNDLLGQADSSGRVWHMVPPEMATIIAVAGDGTHELEHKHEMAVAGVEMEDAIGGGSNEVSSGMSHDSIMMPPPPQPLPADCPAWAHRIKCCEKIGDSYRGYVDSEVDLDLLLTYHKQQTQSFWGTRQSPSPAKPSTRLMWKSQYVPFDGIPFVNSGSRAIVMECQYGPRRKGNTLKKQMIDQYGPNKQCEQFVPGDYRQTCPARIYIKKVKKFPQYAVDLSIDKKTLKLAMDKAFHELKQRGFDDIGHERYYIQLPTDKAHEFHNDANCSTTQVQSPAATVSMTTSMAFDGLEMDSAIQRLDPRVAQKIREIVSGGETRVYSVRKILRSFVVRQLYNGGEIPERHDLTLFPTVNDLKNHIHQALKDIECGSLALTAPTVNVEIITSNDGAQSAEMGQMDQSLWQQTSQETGDGSEPVPETVTVTLTQNPGEDGHVISRIETHLSDGSMRVSTTLTPETAQLLSRLHPNMFPANLLMQQQVDQAVTSISDPSVPPSNNIKVEGSVPLCGVEHIDSSVVGAVGDSIMNGGVTSSDPQDIGGIHIVQRGLGVTTSHGGVCAVVASSDLDQMSAQLEGPGSGMSLEDEDESSLGQATQHHQFVTVTMNESGEIIPVLDVDGSSITSLHQATSLD